MAFCTSIGHMLMWKTTVDSERVNERASEQMTGNGRDWKKCESFDKHCVVCKRGISCDMQWVLNFECDLKQALAVRAHELQHLKCLANALIYSRWQIHSGNLIYDKIKVLVVQMAWMRGTNKTLPAKSLNVVVRCRRYHSIALAMDWQSMHAGNGWFLSSNKMR